MVGRIRLIFWRWVVVLHDRLHTARDKAIGEAIHEKYGTWRGEPYSEADGANLSFVLKPEDTTTTVSTD
jgi:hypothetical protein